jgi:adenylate cyclase
MTMDDADRLVPTRAKRLLFDRFVLDLGRGSLGRDGEDIVLRPKTFAVLRFLSENPNRLVSKDELFGAVWPNLTVTDDVLVQSVGELRRALGDDGPRLIRTIPRRGYRFEATVSSVEPSDELTHSTADSPLLRASSQSSRLHELQSFASGVTGRSGGLFATLAIVTVVIAGALWSGISTTRDSTKAARAVEQSVKGSKSVAKAAVAVLPFLSQNDDAGRDYFADGLTQDVINALGRFSALTVMSWNAVFEYRGKSANPGEIARDLGVRYQVEGSVLQTVDRVRVRAQLVNADGQVLWSARFDEALQDVFALQDKITAQIVAALAIRVTQIEQRRVFAKPTENLHAYDYVLRARPALQRPARANIVEARELLRRAIKLDPSYAAAYAAIAETYYAAVSMGWAESPIAFLSRAEEMAQKALRVDDTEVRARVILGRIHIFYHRYDQALAEMDRAVATNPNDAQGLAGRANVLMWLGRPDAAIEGFGQARRIDPALNPMDRFALSLAYYLKRRYDAAIEQAELNLRETEGANYTRIVLAAAYAQRGKAEEAARVVTTIRRLDPTFDPPEFGTKFLNSADLEHLREGMRKAGLAVAKAGRGD